MCRLLKWYKRLFDHNFVCIPFLQKLHNEKAKKYVTEKENVILAIKNKFNLKRFFKSERQVMQKEHNIRLLEKELMDKNAILDYIGVNHEFYENEAKQNGETKIDRGKVTRCIVRNKASEKNEIVDGSKVYNEADGPEGLTNSNSMVQHNGNGLRSTKGLPDPWTVKQEANFCETNMSDEEDTDVEVAMGQWQRENDDKVCQLPFNIEYPME